MSRTTMVIPETDGPLRGLDGRTFARWSASAISSAESNQRGRRVLLWSGSYAQSIGGGLFDEDPRTWGTKGWSALESGCRSWLDAGVGLCLRPHASHVVSDPIGCRKLLAADWADGIELLYDPLSMLAPSMLGERVVQDHLRRMYEAIEGLPVERVLGVLRPNTKLVPPDFVLDLETAHMPDALPAVVCADQAE